MNSEDSTLNKVNNIKSNFNRDKSGDDKNKNNDAYEKNSDNDKFDAEKKDCIHLNNG